MADNLCTHTATSSRVPGQTSIGQIGEDEITSVLTNLQPAVDHHRKGGLDTAEARSKIWDFIRADAICKGLPSTAKSIAEHTCHWQLQLETTVIDRISAKQEPLKPETVQGRRRQQPRVRRHCRSAQQRVGIQE